MTGAEMITRALEKNGVKIVFGYPGAANCPIIDKLSHSSIKHILTRNEQGAAHMASGYARVTKGAGVCTATSGPGATNLITGIATAYMDSVPIIALTGQVSSSLIGKDAFQEVDITGATMPFVKHSYLVKDGLEFGRVIDEAFYIATTGRPGPVLIDFPMDLLKQEFDYPDGKPEMSIPGYKIPGKANEAQMWKVAAAVKKAKKPLILAGGGIVISDAVNEVRSFVEQTGIPVVSTMQGIGVMPAGDSHYMGMIGSHGLKQANLTLNRADLVLVLGSRLGDRSVAKAERLATKTKLIHIDIDPAEIGKNVQPYLPMVGDIKDVITLLAPLVEGYRVSDEWKQEVEGLREKTNLTADDVKDSGTINPKYMMQRLGQLVNSKAYVSTEVGQNQLWVANNFPFKNPRQFITSAGFGTMGYGLPSAIGAATATDMPVIAVMGDGSFQMDLPELATMCQWNIPVKMIVFQNHRLGMVHEHQYLLYKSNYQAVTLEGSPNFEKLADAYGIPAMTITQNSQIDEGIKTLMETNGSFLLIAEVSPYEPTGGALNQDLLPKK